MLHLSHVKKYHFPLSLTVMFAVAIGVIVYQQKNAVPDEALAQSANSIYFAQTSLSVAPKGTLTLRANAGANQVNFASAAVKIDISKVKVDSLGVSYPLVINDRLFLAVPQATTAQINCAPSSGDPACTNGLIRFALSRCPQAAVTTQTQGLEGCFGITNTAQTGNFDLATIPLTSINDTQAAQSPITYDTVGNELVKEGTNPPTDLPITTIGATLVVPLRGDSGTFDGFVTAGDLLPWRNNYGATLNTGAAAGDFNGDTFVTAGDLAIWRANYGRGG